MVSPSYQALERFLALQQEICPNVIPGAPGNRIDLVSEHKDFAKTRLKSNSFVSKRFETRPSETPSSVGFQRKLRVSHTLKYRSRQRQPFRHTGPQCPFLLEVATVRVAAASLGSLV